MKLWDVGGRFTYITIDERLSCKIANAGFICACLVVSLHVHVDFVWDSWQAWVHSAITGVANVAVPTFFVFSGFLLAGHFGENGWWSREVRKRVRSLILPYVLWNLLFLLFSCALTTVASWAGITYGGELWENLSFARTLQALGVFPPWRTEIPYLWFVRCLIVFVACAPLFLFAKRKVCGAWFVLFIFGFYGIFPHVLPPAEDWRVHFMKISWVQGFCFFSIGAYLRWNGEGIMRGVRRLPLWVWIALAIARVFK